MSINPGSIEINDTVLTNITLLNGTTTFQDDGLYNVK